MSKNLFRRKASLGGLARRLLTQFQQLIFPNESPEYRIWRDEFMWKRLGFCLWGAIPLCLCGTANDLYYWFNFTQVTAEVSPQMRLIEVKWLRASLMHNALIAPLLLTLLIIHKTKWGHRFPGVIFLCLSFYATLVQEVSATFNGFAMGNIDLWRLVFLIQATLIPVRWHLHFVSQLSVVGYYLGVNSALGWQPIEGHQLVSLGSFLMIFWFCLVCNTGVYMYERLQRAEFASRQELRVFLHAITHDLRSPLMGTAIFLQNVLKKSENKVTVSRGVIEGFLESNSRQLDLISALQQAYAYEGGRIKLHHEPLQISKLAKAVIADLELLISQNRVIINNQIPYNLPKINADPVQLRRVFYNLISNALKHNPYGITLTLDAKFKTKKILFYVQDNGVGLSKKQCERIFELYTRGENARLMPGLGIGLYLCRQIIEAHDGKIGVRSKQGDGSTFWFTLPLAN